MQYAVCRMGLCSAYLSHRVCINQRLDGAAMTIIKCGRLVESILVLTKLF